MTAFALMFSLAGIGIAETAYLIRKRVDADRPVCPIGGGCHIVLTSNYNRLFGFHNDVLGFIFYIGMSFLTAFLVIGTGSAVLWNGLIAWVLFIASAMSLFFFYLQWRVIHAWCFWCLMSAFTIFCMDFIFFLSFISTSFL